MSNINITYLEKIIHEMNTPLQNLVMIPDLMLDERIHISKLQEYENLVSLKAAAEKLAQIVRMLSSITNLDSRTIDLNLSKVDLIGLISDEIEYHKGRILQDKKQLINFVFYQGVDHCSVDIDEFWFKQMVSNLIVNAINHMDKGILEIALDLYKEDDKQYLRLRVIDEGWGIPEKEIEEIFQPLHRGSHSVGKVIGSGIGLAVVREVVAAHHGKVIAKNNDKVGATFEVILPYKGDAEGSDSAKEVVNSTSK